MELMIIKITVTILLVVMLAEVSKRTNPLLGGLLLGLPLGVGLSIYFISYSEGIPFLVNGIPWGIAGLASGILFCFFYLLGGRLFSSKNKFVSIILSSLMGFVAFFASGYLIRILSLNVFSATLIFTAVYLLNISASKKIILKNTEGTIRTRSNPYLTVLMRGLVSGIIIVAITGTASIVGSKWAGVLSSFPSMTYTLILILHYEEGNNLYPSIIYGFSYSVSTLAVFYILCSYSLPWLGLNFGFTAAYVLCLVYLFVVKVVSDRLSKLKAT